MPELPHRERLVDDDPARDDGIANRGKEVALEVAGDEHQVEPRDRKAGLRQIGAPAPEGRRAVDAEGRGFANGIEGDVDPVDVEARPGERLVVPASSDGEVECAGARRQHVRGAGRPLDYERRGRHTLPESVRFRTEREPLASALLTSIGIGLLGLLVSAGLGLWAHDGPSISQHILLAIFSTMISLLAHSMFMFYLIGKGKAVKDAMAEGQVAGDYFQRIAAARKPVFSIASYAMVATILTALLGASVDTGMLPPMVHAMIAWGAIACNLAAVKIEVEALRESSRVVDEVNRRLGV